MKINKIKHSKNSKENVYYGLEVGNNHEQDGRVIIAEFKEFLLVNTYVPNAGMKLENLSFRYCFVNNGSFRCRVLIIDVCVFYRGEWDQKLRERMAALSATRNKVCYDVETNNNNNNVVVVCCSQFFGLVI